MWLVGGALLDGCVRVPYLLWTVLARGSKVGAAHKRTGSLWSPWKGVGSWGIDTWFELPVGYATTDDFGGEPDTSYNPSSLVEDYLATLGDEVANEGYYAWL